MTNTNKHEYIQYACCLDVRVQLKVGGSMDLCLDGTCVRNSRLLIMGVVRDPDIILHQHKVAF